jgi:hypothetical protein
MLNAYLNGKNLNELHPSFNNMSKINYYISKNKRSNYPHGTDIIGKFIYFFLWKQLDYINSIIIFMLSILFSIQGVTHEFLRQNKTEDKYIRGVCMLQKYIFIYSFIN